MADNVIHLQKDKDSLPLWWAGEDRGEHDSTYFGFFTCRDCIVLVQAASKGSDNG